jgi:hypothetical protein
MKMKKIKISELIAMESIASSITVSPLGDRYFVECFLKERRKNGICKKRTFVVENLIEDVQLLQVSNSTVKHLGYNTYKHLVQPSGFYINLYQLN